jgi:hypothetical protein
LNQSPSPRGAPSSTSTTYEPQTEHGPGSCRCSHRNHAPLGCGSCSVVN